MHRVLVAVLGLLAASPALAVAPFPAAFRAQEIKTNGTTPHMVIGGHGPAVVMLLDQVATNVTGGVIPDSVHWIMEEQPAATTAMVAGIIEKE
jgi:pimeloyl-ACP methyl ester carboxylesterase